MKIPLKMLVLLAFCPLLLTSCATNTKVIEPEVIDNGGDGGDYEPWVGEILDLDDPTSIDEVPYDKTVYDYSSMSFKTVHGAFSSTSTTYTASSNDSMAINTNSTSPFTHGTYSVDITIPTAGDSGIVFGLSYRNQETFWEGGSIAYYFFFINSDGIAYLGKTNNGAWTALKTVEGYKSIIGKSTPTNLKVLFYGDKIICFVNNSIVIAVRDRNYLTGSGFGFRLAKSSVSVTNIFASSNRVI